jgi:hypothetical protein
MMLPCGALLRVVEFGFYLVAEDGDWADDEDRCNQQRRCIRSKYQPPTTQEYLQIKDNGLCVSKTLLSELDCF